jgi:hypothetical protein
LSSQRVPDDEHGAGGLATDFGRGILFLGDHEFATVVAFTRGDTDRPSAMRAGSGLVAGNDAMRREDPEQREGAKKQTKERPRPEVAILFSGDETGQDRQEEPEDGERTQKWVLNDRFHWSSPFSVARTTRETSLMVASLIRRSPQNYLSGDKTTSVAAFAPDT